MIEKLLRIAAVAIVLAVASVPAFAYYVKVVESCIPPGELNPLFTFTSLGPITARSSAVALPGWTGGGLNAATYSCYYGSDTSARWGDWKFTPTTTGYYDVYSTWATNNYAAGVPAPTWTVHSANADVITSLSQTNGGNAWNLLAGAKQFNAGISYKTRLATPGTGQAGKRTYFDAVAWAASRAGAVSGTGPANGGHMLIGGPTRLSWIAGADTMFFNVWFGTSSGALTKVASNLSVSTLEFDLAGLLSPSTQYFWRVDAGNVDRITQGTEYSFTAVPEPSSMLAFAAGFIGLFGFTGRKRA